MPAKNRINDLRDHLFETLEALRDETKPMDLERARAVADVARVIVDSAKVEVEFCKVTGERSGTGFLPQDTEPDLVPSPRQLNGRPNGVVRQ